MVPEENGPSGVKNTIILEKTIFTDFHETCRLTGTFIMIEFFDLFPDIKKEYRKTYILRDNKQTADKQPTGNANRGRAVSPGRVYIL